MMNAEYWRGRGLQARGWLESGVASLTGDAVLRVAGSRDYHVGRLMASLASQREQAERSLLDLHNRARPKGRAT